MKYMKMVMVVLVFCGFFCGCESDSKDRIVVGVGEVECDEGESGDTTSQDDDNDPETPPPTPPPPPPSVTVMKLIVSNGSAHTVGTSFNGSSLAMSSGGSKEWTHDGSASVTFTYDTLAGYDVTQTLDGDKNYYGLITDSTNVLGTVEFELSSFN